MADEGLQNIKLQDGFKKLLVSTNIEGIASGMNKISTSTGTGVTSSVLAMGVNASTQAALKIKSNNSSGEYFYLENYGTLQSAPNNPQATAISATGDGMLNGIFKIHNILCIDTQVGLGDHVGENIGRGCITFADMTVADGTLDSTSKTWGSSGASIFGKDSGDVVFRMHGAAPVKNWIFDRIKIDTEVSGVNAQFECNAPTARFSGITASGVTRPNGGFIALGGEVSVNTTNAAYLSGNMGNANSSINIWDTPKINLEARSDSSTPVLSIDAVTAGAQNPEIHIGTTDNPTVNREFQYAATSTPRYVSTTLAYVKDGDGAATYSKITDSANEFENKGFAVGQVIDISGYTTAGNNQTGITLTYVGSGELRFAYNSAGGDDSDGDTVTIEVPVWTSTPRTLTGASSITIGTAIPGSAVDNYQILRINSAKVKFGSQAVVAQNLWQSDTAAGAPWHSAMTDDTEGAFYLKEDASSSAITAHWFEGATAPSGKEYEILSADHSIGTRIRHSKVITANLPAQPATDEANTYVHKDASNNLWYVIDFYDGSTRRYKYMQLNDATTPVVWTNATSLPT